MWKKKNQLSWKMFSIIVQTAISCQTHEEEITADEIMVRISGSYHRLPLEPPDHREREFHR